MDYTWLQIFQLGTTLLLLWNLRLSIQQDIEEISHSSSTCFDSEDTTMTLNCSQGHMVRLDDIYYGHSETERCHYWPGDCSMQLPGYLEMYACVGRDTCGINLPTGGQGKYLPRCEEFATYVHAEYTCVPEAEVIDICNTESTIVGQFGYIRTPRYPDNYPHNKQCKLHINAPDASQKISLFIIDLDLEDQDTECSDLLHIFDGHRAATICGTRTREHTFTTLDNWLELEFQSDWKTPRKGFWLMYEAKPYVEITSPVSTQSSTLTSSQTSRSSPTNSHTTRHTVHDTPSHNPTLSNATKDGGTLVLYEGVKITTGAIVGISVCVILIIIVIILVILVCRSKEHTSKLPSTFSCNSESAFLESNRSSTRGNHMTNSASSVMDFSNSQVFTKICEYESPTDSMGAAIGGVGGVNCMNKGPNNIQTAAALTSQKGVTSQFELTQDMYEQSPYKYAGLEHEV